MYIRIFSLPFSRLSFSLTFLSLSLARSLSLVLSLKSLFSPVVSCCVSAGLCHLVFSCVMHARALVLFLSNTFCLSLSMAFSLLLSRCLFLFFCIHICHCQSWEACTQPHLSGFTLGNSLGPRRFNSAELNVAEVPHTRCLPPVVAQVPRIFVHFDALSVFGGGSLSPWSFYHSLQSLNLSLQSVLCLLGLECDLVGNHSASLGIAEQHHQIHYVGSSACQTRICCT